MSVLTIDQAPSVYRRFLEQLPAFGSEIEYLQAVSDGIDRACKQAKSKCKSTQSKVAYRFNQVICVGGF